MPTQTHPRRNVPRGDKALIEEMWEMIHEAIDLLQEIKDEFEAHTHNADGGQLESYFTSPPRTDAATVTAGTASTLVTAVPEKMSH